LGRIRNTYGEKYGKIGNMKQVVRRVSSGLLIGILTMLSLGAHASAQPPQTDHAMRGMSHGASSSSNCITICTSTTFHKTKYINQTDENDDDEPQTPFYVQLLPSPLAAVEKGHSQETRLAMEREPPPGGPPAYIALTVFRA